MGFQIVPLPYAPNGCFAEPLGFGHGARTPVGGIGRRRVQGGFDHRLNFLLGDDRDAAGTGCVLLEPLQAIGQKAFSPKLHRRPGNLQTVANDFILYPRGSLKNNAGTLH